MGFPCDGCRSPENALRGSATPKIPPEILRSSRPNRVVKPLVHRLQEVAANPYRFTEKLRSQK
jgi:hypothetical protein